MARRQPAGGDAARHATPPPDPADPALQDPEPDPESVAHTICLRLLTVRARSRAELAEALRARNVPDDATGRVLDRLAAVGLVNDNAYAADFVHAKRAERGLAGRELSRQLRGKGVADEVIADVLADIDEDAERAVARRLAERKLKGIRGLDTQAQIRRLAGMLARKGYSPAVAFQVVRDVVGEAASEHYDAETMLG